MNLFILSTDLFTNAEYHCDQHLNSQIKEVAQMLSTVAAIHVNGGKKIEHLYAPTHPNHPCTKWIAENILNAEYALRYAKLLNLERQARVPTTPDHSSVRVAQNAYNHMLHFWYSLPPSFTDVTEMTPFAEAMPECIKRLQYPMTTVLKYQLVYRMKRVEWSTRLENPLQMTWTNRPIPAFMNE